MIRPEIQSDSFFRHQIIVLNKQGVGSISRLRHRVYEILEIAEDGDRASRYFDLFIFSLIVLNVSAFVLSTVPILMKTCYLWFAAFELISTLIFTVEYLLRLWSAPENPAYISPMSGRLRYMASPYAVIDLLAVLPFYLVMLVRIDPALARALWILRLFRFAKLARYSKSSKLFIEVIRSEKEALALAFFLLLGALVTASTLMYFAESGAQPEDFGSIPQAMWWGIVTLTTVGYGDVVPVTGPGKLLGGIIAIIGVGVFALPAGILASGFSEAFERIHGSEDEDEEEILCPHCGQHFILKK